MSGESVSITMASDGSAWPAAHLQRAVKRERAAKAELEAHVNKAARLLRTAIESVGNAARHRHLAQRLEHAVHRAAHMQQHRQIKAPRQAQLRAQQRLLVVGVEFGNEVVEPDFAHCHQARVAPARSRAFERLQVGFSRTGRAQGVDAQRVAVAMAVRQRAHRVEVVRPPPESRSGPGRSARPAFRRA
jgi:hypothetical protein